MSASKFPPITLLFFFFRNDGAANFDNASTFVNKSSQLLEAMTSLATRRFFELTTAIEYITVEIQH